MNLQDMTIEWLERYKENLLKQAEELDLGRICQTIAKKLGEDRDCCTRYNWRQDKEWSSVIPTIEIDYSLVFPGTVCTWYRGKRVLVAHWELLRWRWRCTRFTPGSWVEIVTATNAKIEEIATKKRDEELEAKRQELIAELTPIE